MIEKHKKKKSQSTKEKIEINLINATTHRAFKEI